MNYALDGTVESHRCFAAGFGEATWELDASKKFRLAQRNPEHRLQIIAMGN